MSRKKEVTSCDLDRLYENATGNKVRNSFWIAPRGFPVDRVLPGQYSQFQPCSEENRRAILQAQYRMNVPGVGEIPSSAIQDWNKPMANVALPLNDAARDSLAREQKKIIFTTRG